MKANIHPKWFKEAKVTCACGNTFVVGATLPEINVEVCSVCHPFYTGQMKYLDAAGRVEAFKTKLSHVAKKVVSKTEKRRIKKEKKIKEEMSRPENLEVLRAKKVK
ncbi:MAG: 50S ribosomal protein L31 [Candidatus Woesebacteria bacterium]|nr:50S ribosomal protein L31 [Candidatus Woesebacteria bacterium]